MNSFIVFALALMKTSEAIFRSRLSKFTAKDHQDSARSLNMAHKTTFMERLIDGNHGKRDQMSGHCQMPCQREPFWIPFMAVLELGNIPNMLRGTIRSKAGNMIDIGKCIGYCRSSLFSLYQDEQVSDDSLRNHEVDQIDTINLYNLI